MEAAKATPRDSFYFRQSDVDLVRWLTQYHYLQPIHFQKLSGRNIVSVRRRIRQLHEQGYVERLTLPLERPDRVQLEARVILAANGSGRGEP